MSRGVEGSSGGRCGLPSGEPHRGAQDFVAGAHDLDERLVFEAVLGELGVFLVDVDAVAFGAGRPRP